MSPVGLYRGRARAAAQQRIRLKLMHSALKTTKVPTDRRWADSDKYDANAIGVLDWLEGTTTTGQRCKK
ncbi:hypothetical protein RRF57_009814 [Xylaria bambusicola]|uniref:Uncharacterized protein n=1 Tax=Xylaria bambusicola TaxID=326684 RepID=A0AAN7Z250_9PEZI